MMGVAGELGDGIGDTDLSEKALLGEPFPFRFEADFHPKSDVSFCGGGRGRWA